jgi:hypothetical protein
MASKVEAARRLIFEFAKPITGVAVDGLLKEFSGVPTKVSAHFFLQSKTSDTHQRMPLSSDSVLPSTCLIYLLSISYMNLSLEFGRLFSHTSSAFCMRQVMELID